MNERCTIEADEMLRIGFLDELVAPSELVNRVRSLAGVIAANAPLTIATAKYTIETVCADSAMRDITGCDARVRECIESEDHAEGRRAFMEKRVPLFRGR